VTLICIKMHIKCLNYIINRYHYVSGVILSSFEIDKMLDTFVKLTSTPSVVRCVVVVADVIIVVVVIVDVVALVVVVEVLVVVVAVAER